MPELTQAIPVIVADTTPHRHRTRAPGVPASPLHVPGGLPADIDRPTVQRRAEAAAMPRDAELRALATELAAIVWSTDVRARLHQARDFVTAVALTASRPGDPTVIGEATTTIHRAILDGGADNSTAAHFARLAIDALVRDGHL